MRSKRKFFIEVMWIHICFSAAIMMVYFSGAWNPESGLINLYFRNSAVSFSAIQFTISLSLLLFFALMFVRESRHQFARLYQNILAIFAGILFVLFAPGIEGGWTSYAPLAAVSDPDAPIQNIKKMVLTLKLATGMLSALVLYHTLNILSNKGGLSNKDGFFPPTQNIS